MEKNKPNKLLSQLFKISNEDAPVFDTQHLTISLHSSQAASFRPKLGANNRNLWPLEQTCRNNDVLRLKDPRASGDGPVARI